MDQNTTSGTWENETITYSSTVISSGIYNASIMFNTPSGQLSGWAEVDANNDTIVSVTFSGYTITGSLAKTEFDSFMSLFGLEYTYGGQEAILTDPSYFHSTGTAPMTFGTTTFDVTTYVANNLPESVTACGITETLTNYTLEIGTPPGSTLPFITYIHFEGSSSSSPTPTNVIVQLVSMTTG
jgi:hypothetical protein